MVMIVTMLTISNQVEHILVGRVGPFHLQCQAQPPGCSLVHQRYGPIEVMDP